MPDALLDLAGFSEGALLDWRKIPQCVLESWHWVTQLGFVGKDKASGLWLLGEIWVNTRPNEVVDGLLAPVGMVLVPSGQPTDVTRGLFAKFDRAQYQWGAVQAAGKTLAEAALAQTVSCTSLLLGENGLSTSQARALWLLRLTLLQTEMAAGSDGHLSWQMLLSLGAPELARALTASQSRLFDCDVFEPERVACDRPTPAVSFSSSPVTDGNASPHFPVERTLPSCVSPPAPSPGALSPQSA